MAATKHLLAESEDVNGHEATSRPAKKAKVVDANGNVPAGSTDSDVEKALKKQRKKEKKEKKARKEEKKREKKEKKLKAVDESVSPDNEPEVEIPEPVEKPKKEKKEKKDKRDKKVKKNKNEEQNGDDTPSQANGADSASDRNGTTTTPSSATYKQSSALTNLPESEVNTFLETHTITVTDSSSKAQNFRPVMQFSYLPSTTLLQKSPFAAYKIPTPIQAASWPFTLSRRDVIGVAETGSGKTMAFALPCVESLFSKKSKPGVKAVVVSPTRELAMQTYEQMSQLASLVGLKCVCLYGGSSKDDQRVLLGRGADIIVATPGRLKDFMNDGTVSLSGASFVVLDEADRMLDKGFEDDIKFILGSAPAREKRQTLMFTATWPASVQALAASFMVEPVKITIGSGGKETSSGAVELQANTRITQRVEVVDPRTKEQRVLQILKQHQQGKQKNDRILVFCLYKKEATRVEIFLQQRGINVASIHGDLRQDQRTRSLEAFKSGKTTVLVATDVAARGLDIPDVKLVVNVTVSTLTLLSPYRLSCEFCHIPTYIPLNLFLLDCTWRLINHHPN
jgi:ATP-dependent RNA helicase DBP3